MAEIALGGKGGAGLFAIVDDADIALLVCHAWHLSSEGYAQSAVRVDGRYRTILMHRLVLGLARGDERRTDHRNRNRLDNQRANLRICTQALNNQNVGSSGSTSAYRGVSWCGQTKRWRAQLQAYGANYSLGRFHDELEAARVVSEARQRLMPFAVEEPIQ